VAGSPNIQLRLDVALVDTFDVDNQSYWHEKQTSSLDFFQCPNRARHFDAGLVKGNRFEPTLSGFWSFNVARLSSRCSTLNALEQRRRYHGHEGRVTFP